MSEETIEQTETNEQELSPEEVEIQDKARSATNTGAILGIAGTAVIGLSRGVKTSAVVSQLTSVGALVGGKAITGGILLGALPFATAGAFGGLTYLWYKNKKNKAQKVELEAEPNPA
ncbi:MAG: hypothetical protein AAF518_18355 [Spirochaetota bacterium]